MTNNTPDYEDNLYLACNKTQANDLACNKISLTEQWKKGELPDGYYYCKLILNNMKPSIERCKAHCIPMGVSADRGEEVLAEVPDYVEWRNMVNCACEEHEANKRLIEENAQLKELLKEVKDYLPEFEMPMNIFAKIDEALQ